MPTPGSPPRPSCSGSASPRWIRTLRGYSMSMSEQSATWLRSSRSCTSCSPCRLAGGSTRGLATRSAPARCSPASERCCGSSSPDLSVGSWSACWSSLPVSRWSSTALPRWLPAISPHTSGRRPSRLAPPRCSSASSRRSSPRARCSRPADCRCCSSCRRCLQSSSRRRWSWWRVSRRRFRTIHPSASACAGSRPTASCGRWPRWSSSGWAPTTRWRRGCSPSWRTSARATRRAT